MAGAAITLISKIDDRDIQRELQRLERKAGNLNPCLKNIGQYLVESTQGRFTKEVDPAGVKWAALRASTKARKKHSKILTEKGGLRASVIYAVRNNGLRVGTNKPYGATHQFGRDKMPEHKRTVTTAFGKKLKFPVWAQVKSYDPKIPARPFLGFSDEDRERIMEITEDFINR